ncbi:MAG: alcohol dehydrogenase [Geminicoccaceae bacterium]
MRSYQIADWGQPLVYDERPTPTPKGKEVLMRVTAAGICHSDLHIQDGFFDLGEGQRVDFAKLGAELPLTLGHEIVGVVEAIGPDARGVSVGDARIAFPWIGCRTCTICRYEREQFCMTPKFLGARVNGGYSDHVIVPDPSYLVVYDGIPSELACTYACAGLTAFSAIGKIGHLGEDDYLLMIGAGGVGLSGIHMAKELTSAKLIVADIDPDKRTMAKEAGAVEVIDNGDADAVARLIDLTGGGVRAAIDFVGAVPTGKFGMSALRKGGRLIIVGLYGGALPLSLPLMPVKSLTVQGSYVGTLEELQSLVALGKTGKIPAIPLDLRPLDEAPKALDDLRAGHVKGRVILQPYTNLQRR